MAMSSHEHESVQKTAIEAILSCINKASNVTFVVENGTQLLKEIYKKTKSDTIKVFPITKRKKILKSYQLGIFRSEL